MVSRDATSKTVSFFRFMETTPTIIDPKEYGIEETKALTILQSFEPKQVELTAFTEQYSDIVGMELNSVAFKAARELRLKLVKVRTGIADVHKTEKAFFLASGRYVDALKNKLTLPIEQMEEKLTEIEKYEERLEAERKAVLKQTREAEFLPYEFDTSFLPLADMTEEQFTGQLESAKLAFETKQRLAAEAEQARIEAESKAEAERIERERVEAEQREAMRIENERLRKEAEERQKAEGVRLAEEKKVRDEQEAKLKAEREAAAKAFQEQENKRIAAEKELQAKKDAELKAAQEAEAAKQAELSKGDADKVNDLIAELTALKTKYSFKSAKNNKMYTDVGVLLDRVVEHIKK